MKPSTQRKHAIYHGLEKGPAVIMRKGRLVWKSKSVAARKGNGFKTLKKMGMVPKKGHNPFA